jgi:Domain of unknown function (DUF4232)
MAYDERSRRPSSGADFLLIANTWGVAALPTRYRGGQTGLRTAQTIEHMTRALAAAIVIVALAAFAAGCDNGPKEAGPVPTGKSPSSSSTATGQAGESTTTAAADAPLCMDRAAAVKLESQGGAAGTIVTTWRVTNTSSQACRSFGYPGMDFHAASGWLDVQVRRGGVDMINQPPTPVVLEPGKSLYFVSTWGDVDTEDGPCTQFDRVKVTLPDNYTSARVASEGCVDAGLVSVGPVSASPPAY